MRIQQIEARPALITVAIFGSNKIGVFFFVALESHPGHKIAKKQTSGWSGMMGFCVKGGLKESTALVSYLKMFTLAESLGGHDSLIEIP